MRNYLKAIIPRHIFLTIFLAFYFVVISYKLVSNPTPFYDWDESINVQVSKETIEKNSLVPLWQDKAWLDKPPLPFLLFGAVMKFTPFVQPEISLRIISLILSILALIFVYVLFLKTTQQTTIPLLTVVITAFTPIFLQRSQIVNLDVFLLIGWLGYLLFFENFWLSFVFLAIGVLTKSLLGFYPVFIVTVYYFFLFLSKKINIKQLKEVTKKMALQVGILLLWYLGMLFVFGGDFWQQHIIDTHFRRVAASIESHFGKRTYYIELMFEQLGVFVWISLFGFFFVIMNLLQDLSKKNKIDKYLYSLFLLPWFLFLNLTKTKIFWYLYPAIPQFAFFIAFPLSLFRHKKIFLTFANVFLFLFIFHQNFIKTNFFATFYSQPEDHYRLSLYAKDRCKSLTVLVAKETRDSMETLENLGLTITSTKQWGDHPSIVYYFGKKVKFYFDRESFYKYIPSIPIGHCFTINKSDLVIDDPRLRMPFFIGLFGDLNLLKKMY